MSVTLVGYITMTDKWAVTLLHKYIVKHTFNCLVGMLRAGVAAFSQLYYGQEKTQKIKNKIPIANLPRFFGLKRI